MTYGFVVYYRFRIMTSEEAEKSKEFWKSFRKEGWPEDLDIIGDYKYAWGTDWNGFLILESDRPETFFEFWPVFREKTRWYIDNTRTVIGIKNQPEDLMKSESTQ